MNMILRAFAVVVFAMGGFFAYRVFTATTMGDAGVNLICLALAILAGAALAEGWRD